MRSLSSTSKHISFLLQRTSSLRELTQTHALLTKTGLAYHPPLLAKLLALSALSPWGSLAHARSLFDAVPIKSVLLYNVLIRAYSQSIFPTEAIHLYNHMCRLHLLPDKLTFPFVFKACGRAANVEREVPRVALARKGSEVHCRAFRLGLERDGFIQNSLMSMYSQCGRVRDASKVFDEMVERTTVSYNIMIAAYDRNGEQELADRLFYQMEEKSVVSWNSMITRHVRLGDVNAARKIFDEMSQRDAISWNTLMAGYIQVKNYKHALELFKRMQANDVEPTELTIVSVLGACAETGALEMGKKVHKYLRDKEFKIEGYVGNALLDMYAKCGNLKLAWQVFDAMGMKHVTCWNTMIVALAVHGHCKDALELFASMEREASLGVKPNRVTFLGVLLACSHKGLLKEGQDFFQRMVKEYNIEPDIKHYGCMVDMLSRCGLVDEAFQMIKEMPMKENSVLWKTVLGACRVHGDVELAEEAFKELAELAPLSDADYVLMSNIYAEAERWEDVERLRTGMIGDSISKQQGCTQIELD
ncbi:pentatricopeptide repeat-containing protein At5g15300 [Elaeis guineensis]|uniref:Pentatricopeptide repeat-containing protein At5g15300 n=1 Tax=Elaeis guineensis var. tenera TaxID=51953 RepID=A0A6I9R9C9_ELAGV|nr:pentatricopeptide repeat-containing protein At5g15300 [Elaeis guineensis]